MLLCERDKVYSRPHFRQGDGQTGQPTSARALPLLGTFRQCQESPTQLIGRERGREREGGTCSPLLVLMQHAAIAAVERNTGAQWHTKPTVA